MLRRIAILAVAAVSLLAITAGIAAGQGGEGRAAKAVLHDANGVKVGVVRFTESRGGVRVRVEVTGAGGRVPRVPRPRRRRVHRRPSPRRWGTSTRAGWATPGMPATCPSCSSTPTGRARRDSSATESRLADLVGRALIVHAGPDNYANIPTRYAAGGPDATTLATGDAGGRAACGVIERRAQGTTSRSRSAGRRSTS